MTDVDAVGEKRGIRIGQMLEKGVLTIPDNSKVGIAMHSGARLQVRGPASLNLESAEKLRMNKGRISSYVPEYARGLTTDTDDGKVVDLGTRFVTATGGGHGTEIHVEEGVVEAYAIREGTRPWSLTDENAGVLKDGKFKRIDYLKKRFDVPLDPVLPDQDDDGESDTVEIQYGYDPHLASSQPEPYGSRFRTFSSGEPFGQPLDEATHLFVVRVDRTCLTTDVFMDPVLGRPETAAVRKVRYYEVPGV
ncbi:MAG: hypothetical protein EOP84_07035 [Verrucomicrobiaceae bacterium]|nr:MAG: hypothetical protein EOP84_07035 [Verrucomicrobiaceae bacterium]